LSKVAVIGGGYVGLTTAACLADLGNDVMVVDINREKIAQLKNHHVPFYEPGLSELVERNAKAGRLQFTTAYEDAVPGADYALIAVSTLTSRMSKRRRTPSPSAWMVRSWSSTSPLCRR
jgi:UDPglucose 6-dehydrogenase